MSDSLQYEQCRQLIDNARQSDKEQRYLEAAQIYKQAYDLCHSEFAGSRYMYCLRQSGAGGAREAVSFGRAQKDLLRSNEHARREYAWALYGGYLKEAKEDTDEEVAGIDEPALKIGEEPSNFRVTVRIARTILKLVPSTDTFLRKLTVFAICKEAKRLKKWEYIEEFARRLDVQTLSLEPGEFNGRRLPSDYQRWAFSVTRALLESERYEECIAQAHEASEKLPENERFHFLRWETLARVRMGQAEEGLKQLEYINVRYPKQWYVQSDIASVLVQLGQYEPALLWFCRSMSMPGDLKGRIATLKSMCEILQRLERWQVVYEHLRLIWAIELELGSTRNAERTEQHLHEFQRLHADQLQAISAVPTLSSAVKPCRATWQKLIQSAQPTQRGRISFLNEEKRYGFVTNDDGRFHFKFNVFRGKPELNMWVEFETESTFDQKRGEVSTSAVNVRLAKGPEPKV